MQILIALIVSAVFSWCCAGALRKKPLPFYIGGTLLTCVMLLLGMTHLTAVPAWVNTYVLGLFTHGMIAASLWCIVALTGAFPNGSALQKRMLPCRGELSIFAALITVSHAVIYGVTYIKRLISGREADGNFVLSCIVCLLLMVIMIPLTILSFKAIRKKVKASTWKKIQRAAYGFYALIYIHVLVILLPRARMGREGTWLSILVYTVMFLGYAALRIHKLLTRKKPEQKGLWTGLCTAGAVICAGVILFAARPVQQAERTTPETGAAETTAPVSTESTTEAASTESASDTSETTAAPTSETAATSTTETTSETTTTETTGKTQESAATEAETEAAPAGEEPAPEQAAPVEEAPAVEPEPVPELQYNSGTYSVTLFGYDAEEHFEITIEEDRITAINGWCDESDPWYFNEAMNVVCGAIIAANSPDVPDAVSGATISSDAIKQAVRQALDQARR